MTPIRYHWPEALRFKHLAIGDLFVFPASRDFADYQRGPYIKISPRKYQPCEAWLVNVKIRSKPYGSPILIGSVNAKVSQCITDLFFYQECRNVAR